MPLFCGLVVDGSVVFDEAIVGEGEIRGCIIGRGARIGEGCCSTASSSAMVPS